MLLGLQRQFPEKLTLPIPAIRLIKNTENISRISVKLQSLDLKPMLSDTSGVQNQCIQVIIIILIMTGIILIN